MTPAAVVAALALAFALAMDAFAVALTQGARFRPSAGRATVIALTFGAAQGIMPLIGWSLGSVALSYIAAWDHWIAFALLGFLGLRMIRGGEEEAGAQPLGALAIVVAAIATSIDALAAGFTLPTLDLPPLGTAALIATVTFALSVLGIALGRRIGDRFGRPAEVLGGLILIAIGARILVAHLFGL